MNIDAAVKHLGVPHERIIFVEDPISPLLAVVTSDKRVSEEKLVNAPGAGRVRRANLFEVKVFTSYNAGAVPPLGHKTGIITFIDERVIAYEKFIGARTN
jgi:prolyl-tRNA editing enzyme YbaK/EbsC (Cys-tRNA(Pro) deacylase)